MNKLFKHKSVKSVLITFLFMMFLTSAVSLSLFWDLYVVGAVSLSAVVGLGLAGFATYFIGLTIIVIVFIAICYLLWLSYKGFIVRNIKEEVKGED